MENYTIYCTTNQTKKAFELGAPIKRDISRYDLYGCLKTEEIDPYTGYNIWLIPPTAEQMIGWLEDKGITVKIVKCDIRWFARPCSCKNTDFNKDGYCSRKEATLAAIDSALDYLMMEKEVLNE